MASIQYRWVLTLLVAAGLLAGCSQAPPEQRLREAISAMQVAISSGDAVALEALLAEDFIGTGGVDRKQAVRRAKVTFLRYPDVGLILGPLDIELQPEHAQVHFTAALSGGSGRRLPVARQIFDVETGWRLDDGQWHLTSAHWVAVL